MASRLGHEANQLLILGDADGTLADPPQAVLREHGEELSGMAYIPHDVVVDKEDIGRRPAQGLDLPLHLRKRAGAIGSAIDGRHRAEFTVKGAATGSLDGVLAEIYFRGWEFPPRQGK